MKRFIYGAATGLCMLLAPCAVGQEKKAEPGAQAPAGQAPVADAAPKVKLLDAGAEPRRELRYTPKAGTSEKSTLKMKMSSESEMNGQKLMSMAMPTMVIDMDVKVDEVRPNGDIALTMVVSRTDVEAGATDNPAMVEAVRTAVKGVVGVTGTTVVTSRGETIEVDFKVPETADATARQMVESMKASARQMASPLPLEPVGKGARWDVMTSVKSAGIVIDQTSTMTLREISGTDLDLAISVVQKAARQALDLPQLPPGAVAELTGLKSEGSGSTKVSLNSVLPTEAKLSMSTDQELRVAENAQAEAQLMKQKVKVEMSVKRGAAEGAGSAPKETPAGAPKK